jgi:hypothetical protein
LEAVENLKKFSLVQRDTTSLLDALQLNLALLSLEEVLISISMRQKDLLMTQL